MKAKARDEFKNMLLKQYKLYPKMQLIDFIKLIYQNEFAGGHMIEDEMASLRRLKEEYALVEKYFYGPNTPDLFEDIGNGLCRINLWGMQKTSINLTTINKFFVETANSIKGDIESFEYKLEMLRECIIDESLPYLEKDLDRYIEKYKGKDYPPISHSKIYREEYLPAYRIVKKEYCQYFKVFEGIDSLMRKKEIVNVAIDGNAGAGKSTLARLLGKIYDCNIFHMDDYFLRPEQRTRERLSEIGGNVDYTRFNQEIVEGIQNRYKFEYRPYNCQTMALEEPILVKPKKLNIIEGVYSMHPTLIDNYDLKIFLKVDTREQSERILKRNGPKMQRRFLEEWIPLENEYFEKFDIEARSDLVFI